MNPRNLQTVIAYRDQDLIIDLGKQFDGEIRASMSRDTDTVGETKDFEIVDNQFLKLLKEQAKDEISDENEVISTIIGRWYFDVRQVLNDKDRIIYTGTIFFKGNITQ